MRVMDDAWAFRTAKNWSDRHAAFELIYQSYLLRGQAAPNRIGMRVTPYQIHSNSQIFVGTHAGRVAATVTLVRDGALGLPMEQMFGQEVEQLRRADGEVAEASCLVVGDSYSSQTLQTFSGVTRIMVQFARFHGIRNLLIAVHPRHLEFYRRYFGFRSLSKRVAECPHVLGQPAVGMLLNFERFDQEQPKCWSTFFGEWISENALQPESIPPPELKVLNTIVKLTTSLPLKKAV